MASADSLFEIDQSDNSIGFVFSSTMENIDAACEKITGYLVSRIEGIEPRLFPINLVLREGLSNAIRHGNKNDSQKRVRLLLTIKPESSIQVEIEDQGDGFDWRKQRSEPLADDQDHGRGIIIMNTYFSRYSYNDKGNILYLEKDLDP